MLIRGLRSFSRFALYLLLSAVLAAPVQAEQSSTAALTNAQLEQLVAPIALHPDPLLSQMLMASTYPTEVVQAARWARENSGVTGQALQDAMLKQTWDPSVKALTAVPQTLQMMSDKLDWTQRLGDAFLGQQADLLAAVQRLRHRAEAAGHLKTSEQQTVNKVKPPAGSGASSRITIEPASTEYLYVPVYDPRICYGDWPYPEYEPYYWYPAGFSGGGVLAFAAAVAVGSALWGRFDWWRDRVDIDVNRFNQFNRTNITDKTWRHDARHRGNVPYRDAKVAQRFGDANRAAARDSYRGKAEAGRRDLAKAKATKPGGDLKAKSAAKTKQIAHTNQAGKGKSAAAHAKRAKTSKTAQTGHRAKPKHASRPTNRAYSYAPRGAQRHARPGGGGHRVAMRGGGGRHGGGGRRGRR